MTFRFNRMLAAAATGAAALALTAACSSNGSASPSAAAPTSSSAAPTTAAGSQSTPSTPSDVTTAVSKKLGTVLVDAQGRTLYRFDKDSSQPPASTCADACAANWPPVPATTNITGVDSSLVGSIARADGTKQLTIGGWPVYRFAKDTAAGDTNGEGVKGLWWAVAPDGSQVKSAG